jgi:hypothetical protein
MKPEEFEQVGSNQYRHIANGVKREELMRRVLNGSMSHLEFVELQKKIRGGKYLKYLYSKREYLSAINPKTT